MKGRRDSKEQERDTGRYAVSSRGEDEWWVWFASWGLGRRHVHTGPMLCLQRRLEQFHPVPYQRCFRAICVNDERNKHRHIDYVCYIYFPTFITPTSPEGSAPVWCHVTPTFMFFIRHGVCYRRNDLKYKILIIE